MRSAPRKPGFREWKRIPGVVQRVHRTPTEWREILARFRASGQSKTKFCEQNAIARSHAHPVGAAAGGGRRRQHADLA